MEHLKVLHGGLKIFFSYVADVLDVPDKLLSSCSNGSFLECSPSTMDDRVGIRQSWAL
jgi:hypothetical protein